LHLGFLITTSLSFQPKAPSSEQITLLRLNHTKRIIDVSRQ
jgi:hypothetical protein